MGSSSGNSSGSSRLQNSSPEEDLQVMKEQRKRKRMESNRESARRSRMRKQQHLDDLMAQTAQLRKDNDQLVARINIATQHSLNVEAENSVLRAQMLELSQRLDSLNDILTSINTTNGLFESPHPCDLHITPDNFINNPMNFLYNQPIMASADMFQW